MRRVSHFFTEEKHRTQSRIFTHGPSPCSVKARIKSYELSSYSIHFFPFSLVSADHVFRTTSDFYSFTPNSPFAHCQTFTRLRQIRPSRIVRLSLVSAKSALARTSDFYSFPPNSPFAYCQTFTRFRQMRLHPFDRFDFLYLLISTSASSTDIITRYSLSKENNIDKNFWYHHI